MRRGVGHRGRGLSGMSREVAIEMMWGQREGKSRGERRGIIIRHLGDRNRCNRESLRGCRCGHRRTREGIGGQEVDGGRALGSILLSDRGNRGAIVLCLSSSSSSSSMLRLLVSTTQTLLFNPCMRDKCPAETMGEGCVLRDTCTGHLRGKGEMGIGRELRRERGRREGTEQGTDANLSSKVNGPIQCSI